MSSNWNACLEPDGPSGAWLARGSAQNRIKSAILATLAVMSLATSGCSVVHNGYAAMSRNGSWNETVLVLRNRSHSAKAWHRRKHRFCKERYTKDFCNGFRAGYEEAAAGSDGCTPAFPPSEYWSWEYQSAEGHGKTSAWFSGYPQGARAAEEDGIVNWNQVQMSNGVQSGYQDSQNYNAVPQQGTLYPIPDAAAQNGEIIINGSDLPIETLPVGPAILVDPPVQQSNGTLPLNGPMPIVQ